MKWTFVTTGEVTCTPAIDADGVVFFGCMNSSIYAVNPDGSEKWNITTGGQVHSSPLVTPEGLVIAGSMDGYIYAIDSGTGSIKWKYPAGATPLDPIYSSPATGPDGTVYIASQKEILALDITANPTTQKWSHTVTTADLKSSPAVGPDGMIYVGTRDNALISLKPDGSVNWSYTNIGDIRSSPAIGPDGTIYICDANSMIDGYGHLYALNPSDGSQKWTYPVSNVYDQSPAIDGDGVVYIASADNFVHAIRNGVELWRYPGVGGSFSSIAIGKNQTLYYVGTGDQPALFALGPSSWPMFRNNLYHAGATLNPGPTTNHLKWSTDTGTFSVNPANQELCSSPAIGLNGMIYIGGNSLKAYYPDGTLKWDFNTEGNVFMSSPAIGHRGIIYAADLAGMLYALDPATGAEITRYASGSAAFSSPVIDPGGTIYFGTDDGKIHAVYPVSDVGVMALKWDYLAAGPIKSSPAIGLDGSILVGSDDGKLYSLKALNGSLIWSYGTPGTIPVRSSPTVDDKAGKILFGSGNHVIKLKADGALDWDVTPGGAASTETFESSPALNGDGSVVYIGSAKTGGTGAVYALNFSDGSVVTGWPYTSCGPVLASPAIGGDGLVYFGDTTGKLFALKADGSLSWSYETGPAASTYLSSSPAIGMDKTLYTSSYDWGSGISKLLAIGASSGYISLPAASLQIDPVNAYRMIGIPVTPKNSDTFDNLAPFWSNTYSPSSWRLFAYSGTYKEIDRTGLDSIGFGKGWFIISKNEQPKIEIAGAALQSDFTASVGSGYILLACPFQDKQVDWATVVSDNSGLQLGADLYYWNGSGNYVVSTIMEPWKSYYAYVTNPGMMRISREAGTFLSFIGNPSKDMEGRSPIQHPRRCQPPPPLAPGASIHITSPNGNEVWTGGEKHSITWKSIGISPEKFVSFVKISISLDGGTTYSVLKNRYPDCGFFHWKVGDGIQSDKCLIKVSSLLYPNISDGSDMFFRIQ